MSKSMKAMGVVRRTSHSFCMVLLLLSCGELSAQNQEHRIRNIVLVHGAWADGSGWKFSPTAKRRLSPAPTGFTTTCRRLATVEMKGYFLPSAKPPSVSSCTVITSGPVIRPAMMGLSGTVS